VITRVAFVVFEGMTALDFVGVYDPLTRLHTMGFFPSLSWSVCARDASVVDTSGLRLVADRVGQSLEGFDLLVVPGGIPARALAEDEAYLRWIRTAQGARMKASVCTGALLLGAAGFLQGRRATTHPSAYDLLAPHCREVVKDQRVVDEGEVITARGVTAAIDLGLHLCRRIAGDEVVASIKTQMDWPYS
jgi:transcriptional regulator GlxA family with amidase domain